MMKSLIVGLALAFGVSSMCLADGPPPSKFAMLEAPAFPFMGPDSKPAPTIIVLIACRTDDLTGYPGRHDPNMAANDWRDLELHVVGGEVECKREVQKLEDAVAFNYPRKPYIGADMGGDGGSDGEPLTAEPLSPDFGDPTQCARAGVPYSTEWDRRHKGWSVIAIGCPTPITDSTGKIIDWHLPECPSHIAGLQGIRCKFDESTI